MRFYVDHAVPKGFLHLRRTRSRRPAPAGAPIRSRRTSGARSASATRPRSRAPRPTSEKTLEACAPFAPRVPFADRRAVDDRGAQPHRLVPRRASAPRRSRASSPSAGGRRRSRARSGARDGPRTAQPAPVDTDEVRRALIHGLGAPATLVQWNDTRAFEDAAFVDALMRARLRSAPRRPGLRIALLGRPCRPRSAASTGRRSGRASTSSSRTTGAPTRDLARSTRPGSDLFQT